MIILFDDGYEPDNNGSGRGYFLNGFPMDFHSNSPALNTGEGSGTGVPLNCKDTSIFAGFGFFNSFMLDIYHFNGLDELPTELLNRPFISDYEGNYF